MMNQSSISANLSVQQSGCFDCYPQRSTFVEIGTAADGRWLRPDLVLGISWSRHF